MQTSATLLMAIWIGEVVLAENNNSLALTFAYPIATVVLGVMKTEDFEPAISVAGDVNEITHRRLLASLWALKVSPSSRPHCNEFRRLSYPQTKTFHERDSKAL